MLSWKVESLMAECDELLDDCVKESVDIDTLKCMNSDDLNTMQKAISLYKKSKELAIEVAKTYDDINEKMDKIIKLLETDKKNQEK